ncbi:MAG TPA: phosphatase PAP2 family protein [Spirochaetia bacterium]|nr:phosphatase PAP2 family protein [Spirochaetia bacterium]
MKKRAAMQRNQIVIYENTSRMAGRSKIGPRIFVLAVIVLAMIVIMGVLARYDYEWTIWLNQHRVEWLDEFMGRTLFEGGGYGGVDTTSLFVAAVFFLYFYAWLKPGSQRLERWRPYLGFIMSTGFTCSFLMVHSLKWVVGRARPGLVFTKALAYSEWHEFGPRSVTEGILGGSLPSGHTATVLCFLTLAYILLASPDRSTLRRTAGLIWGFISIAYCLLMALGRIMASAHWLADCMFSILVGWLILHILYFWVLRVPVQALHYRRYGTHADTPKLWELRLCWLIFLVTLGGTATAIGIRSFWELPFHWMAALVPPGIFLVVFFGRRLGAFHKRVFEHYPSSEQTLIS